MSGGWNQRIPPGVARCTCRPRRLLWAMLSPNASAGCCDRSCCQARVSAVMCTRDEVAALRLQAHREGWLCPRCGEPVARHWKGFLCVDARTQALREKKQASYHPTGRTP